MNKTAAPVFVTRHVGSCQICEGDFKLDAANHMVHHGYTRPGYGYNVGDCSGVAEDPYEVSCALLPPRLRGVEAYIECQREYLAEYVAGRVDTIVRDESKWDATTCKYEHVAVTYERATTRKHTWNQVYESKQHGIEALISQGEFEVARIAKRIANWRPMPIRELTEEFVAGSTPEARQAKAEAKAVRDAKHATLVAKREAIKAKHAARAAKRKAMLDEAGEKIRTAYATLPENEARGAVLAILTKLGKKANAGLLRGDYGTDPYNWEQDLKVDDVLKALGLTETEPNCSGEPRYKSTMWQKF